MNNGKYFYTELLSKITYGVPTFTSIEIALRIYLVLMFSNCSGEQSFSKMEIEIDSKSITNFNDSK